VASAASKDKELNPTPTDSWKSYWPLCERLEREFCDLSFSIAFCDSHLDVHSVILADLLVRVCVECENIGKALCIEKSLCSGNVAKLTFPALCSALRNGSPSLRSLSVQIAWPYQTFTNATVTPFATWDPIADTNPTWYAAYNKVKHDRVANGNRGTLGNTLQALGSLFILNLWMRKSDIENMTYDVAEIDRTIAAFSRLFSASSFMRPSSADGLAVTGGVSTKLRNIQLHL
jgi:hypothetical protein